MALLTVLLLVAVMSVMAVTVLDEIRFGLRRTANAQAVGQARWYAMGAEALARARIGQLTRSDFKLTGWSGRAVSYPVDGGLIQARISDGGNCFNLNSVVAGPVEGLRRSDKGVAQFVTLTEALGLTQRQGELLAAGLVDWIDADPLRESGGAEDESYDGYRTAGGLLAERSELRAIRGFAPDIYARLKPHVCALPNANLTRLNVNTLNAGDAPLLVMATDGKLALAAARRLIASRPAAGWSSTEFVQLPAFDDASVTLDSNQITDKPRVFRLETEVTFGDAEVTSSALFETDAAGRTRLVARRWGPEE